MSSTRRVLTVLGLSLAVIAGASLPAAAEYADSAAVATTIATAAVAAPANVQGSLTCGRSTATMGATWNLSTTARVSGYTVSVYFSDGFVQKVELGPSATSWSAPIDTYFVTAFSVEYSVTTKTDYGWTTESARTGAFQC